MAVSMTKMCVVCGDDVSQKKRIKDDQGRYFCHPCWNSASSSQGKPTAPLTDRKASRELSRTDVSPPSFSPDNLPVVSAQTPSSVLSTCFLILGGIGLFAAVCVAVAGFVNLSDSAESKRIAIWNGGLLYLLMVAFFNAAGFVCIQIRNPAFRARIQQLSVEPEKPKTLNQLFVSLNPLTGKTRAQIVAVVGQYKSFHGLAGNKALYQWQQGGFSISLIFNGTTDDAICEGITSQINP